MSTEQEAELGAEEWVAEHPEVTAAAPGWANKIGAADDFNEQVALSYDRDFGSVEIGTAATWIGGVVHNSDPAPAYVYFRKNERAVTSADLHQYAAEFTAAAEAMEAAGV